MVLRKALEDVQRDIQTQESKSATRPQLKVVNSVKSALDVARQSFNQDDRESEAWSRVGLAWNMGSSRAELEPEVVAAEQRSKRAKEKRSRIEEEIDRAHGWIKKMKAGEASKQRYLQEQQQRRTSEQDQNVDRPQPGPLEVMETMDHTEHNTMSKPDAMQTMEETLRAIEAIAETKSHQGSSGAGARAGASESGCQDVTQRKRRAVTYTDQREPAAGDCR